MRNDLDERIIVEARIELREGLQISGWRSDDGQYGSYSASEIG